jgi:hypothetical protein
MRLGVEVGAGGARMTVMSWRIGRRGGGIVVLVLALAGAAVTVERGVHRWLGAGLPTGEAEWIWAALPLSFTEPVAFWAVRDFALDELPAAAELSILGDDEYVAYLNGRRVGSNRYRPGMPVDRYRVEELLVPGGNRLAVELRSARGAGGLLARLDLGPGRRAIESDATWRIVRRHHPGLVRGWLPLGDAAAGGADSLAEEPYVWGSPPVGRWGRPREVAPRPLAAAVAEPCAPRPAVASEATPGAGQVFDWGGEVFGYLTLRLDPATAAAPAVGLLLTGPAPRRPLEDPEAAVAVVPLPGLPVWTDTVPRRFRYATISGLPKLLAAAVIPVSPETAPLLPAPTPNIAPALLGLDTPLHLTPAEKAVRRQIDGLP